ncbi:MAG: 50S ribosomal protein L24e [Candidatus Aenigmarchaeota archaeon]|nr:50S ribosomal protein L24e [Candidatus Aenigmarchaeota archaeon]
MKCSFCNETISKTAGKMFVKTDGTIFYFCSSKCQNNYKLKRNPKNIGWVRKKQTSGKETAKKTEKK